MTPRQTQSRQGSTCAEGAEPSRPSAFQRLMAAATEARSGLARRIEPTPRLTGAKPTTPDLTARAVRVCNRDPALIERYLRVHQILANKPSGDE